MICEDIEDTTELFNLSNAIYDDIFSIIQGSLNNSSCITRPGQKTAISLHALMTSVVNILINVNRDNGKVISKKLMKDYMECIETSFNRVIDTMEEENNDQTKNPTH